MTFEVVRYASAEEMRRWRTRNLPDGHRRFVGKAHSNPQAARGAQMAGGVAQKEAPRPIIGHRTPDDTLDRLIRRRVEALQRIGQMDPVALRNIVQNIRATNPGLLGALSDEDAMRRLHEWVGREQEAVVQRVYNKNRFWGVGRDISEVLNGNARHPDN